MRVRMFISVAVLLGFYPLHSIAEDLNTCVINGLRGVSSDVAARMVRQACESKVEGQRQRLLADKYGERIDEELKRVDFSIDFANNTVTVEVKNEMHQSVLYIELGVAAPDAKEECPWTYPRKYLYQVKIKPGGKANLVIPEGKSFLSKKYSICYSARAVRGRQPNFLDISIGVAKPMSEREVTTINQELGTKYTITEAPKFDLLQYAIDQALKPLEQSSPSRPAPG